MYYEAHITVISDLFDNIGIELDKCAGELKFSRALLDDDKIIYTRAGPDAKELEHLARTTIEHLQYIDEECVTRLQIEQVILDERY